MKYIENYFKLKPSDKIYFYLILLFGFIANILFAYNTLGYYHADEHFQIIEFFNSKINSIPPSEMAWEFSSEIRPWLQSFLLFISYKFFSVFGIEKDPFFLSFLFRLEFSVLAFFAQVTFSLALFKFYKSNNIWKVSIFIIFLFYLFPFLAARTSSENFSTSLNLIALSLLLFSLKGENISLSKLGQNLNIALYPAFFIGILSGLVFEARFQSIFITFGFIAWTFFNINNKIKFLSIFCLGYILSIILCTFIDSYCYGHFVFTPWKYLESNIFHGVAAKFGVYPFYQYFIYLSNYFITPLNALFFILLISGILIYYRNIFVWTIFSYIFIHSLIGHKEERFLFPIYILTVPIVVQAFFFIKEKFKLFYIHNKNKYLLKFLKIFKFTFITILIFSVFNNFLVLFITLYEVKSDRFAFLNDYGFYYARDVKALRFLEEKIPVKEYYGFDHDIQCSGASKKDKVIPFSGQYAMNLGVHIEGLSHGKEEIS
ncbi:hypothetical protein [Silvanigrella aquatica]|uniref:Mannosyltransferase n=1 Tax=Silvanigrella aquatica TaxID=1915309 RepID=A0A1L4D2M8_9BACT|nr:hypothetical protein [Silvanigrella aquatica]APJ04458.1 hypothetical protein AXG55_11275 [Silvanigrella aquatica]